MAAGQPIVPPNEAPTTASPAAVDRRSSREGENSAKAARTHSILHAISDFFARAFNTAVLNKNRLAWVDYLRGIAILLVIYRHVLLGIQNSGFVLPAAYLNANIMFFSFRMPLFFILSGVFITGSLARKSLGRIIYSKFELLLYPYFIWATVQITIQIFASRYTNSNRTVHDYLYLFYQPEQIDQFWYLPALFNSTIVYLFTKTKLNLRGWMQLLLGLTLYFLSPFCSKVSMMSNWMEYYIFYAIGDTMSTLFFRENVQAFLKNRFTFPCLFPIFMVTQFYYLHLYLASPNNAVPLYLFLPIALFGCLTMCTLAYRFQAWNVLRILRVLGYHSLYIYVIHVIVAAAVRVILTKVFGLHEPLALLFIGIVCAATIPVMIYNLFILEKPLYFLFTLTRYPRQRTQTSNKTVPA